MKVISAISLLLVLVVSYAFGDVRIHAPKSGETSTARVPATAAGGMVNSICTVESVKAHTSESPFKGTVEVFLHCNVTGTEVETSTDFTGNDRSIGLALRSGDKVRYLPLGEGGKIESVEISPK